VVCGGELAWHRRTMRQAAPDGYVAVAELAGPRNGLVVAALRCVAEKATLEVGDGRWRVSVDGREAASGPLPDGPPGLFAKRTPHALVLGCNGRWVHAVEAGPLAARPQVMVGVGPAVAVRSFRLVRREAVRFADDFPDPEPIVGVWEPVQGSWALSSLSFADRSANPAELAAVFDKPDDVASRGRTRKAEVGIGVLLGAGSGGVYVARVASDSDGKPVDNILDAIMLLRGKVGSEVAVKFERPGKTATVRMRREIVEWGKARRYVPMLPASDDQSALIVAGKNYWCDYTFRCSVRTWNPGGFGLVFAYLDEANYHVFRWLGERSCPGGLLVLERVRGGRRHRLAEARGDFFPVDFYALEVRLGGGRPGQVAVECLVDGQVVVRAKDDAIVPGKVGLWAEAPGTVFFDDVAVAADPEELPASNRGVKSVELREDRVMRYWANPAYQWVHSGAVWWHKSPFYGDVAVSCPVGAEEPTRQVICATEHETAAGYEFVLNPAKGTSALARAGKQVARKPLGGKRPSAVSLSRRGGHIRVDFDGEPWMEFNDPDPLKGTLVAVACPSLREVQVSSPNVFEDYFSGCPTEWHVLDGYWEVMNRWVCDPRWSFFGGRNDEGLAAIWSKRRLEGDCALEVDVGVMMMEMNTSYKNMRDVGVAICAKDYDVASGYAAIVGARGNTRTLLFRRGKLVASTTSSSALLPRIKMGGSELYTQHRGWFHVRLEKHGKTIRLYLWDRLALAYEDPEPLGGGHAAVWTVRNGLLVAKARLAAERLSAPMPQFRRFPTFADHVLSNDCGNGATGVTLSGSTYEIVNGIGGGPFALALRPRVFSAFDIPKLAFDIKAEPGTKVDFYLECHGKRYRIVLTGPVDPVAAAETLKVLPDLRADGRWHHVEIDLLGELRRLYPEDESLLVWEPTLANYSNDGYLLAGIGGNRAGARYWLRNVVLGTSEALANARGGQENSR